MTQPDLNPTLEAFKAKMLEKHERTLRASMELVRISNGILYEPIAEPLHKVMRVMTRIIVNSNGAVLTVATAGYGNDAAKIVRSMFEGAVTIAYLRKYPDLVFDYIDYYRIKRWQYFESVVAKDPELVTQLGDEKIAEMKTEYEAVLPKFLNKKGKPLASWCKVSVYDRATAVGLGQFYPAFYAQASGMTHLDMSGLMAQANANALDVEVAPSETYVSQSLAMAYNTTFRALFDFNEEAKLGYNDALEVVHNFYIVGMKKQQEGEA